MSQQYLFPSEIIEFTTESHYVSNSRTFRWVYYAIVLGILILLFILPIISVDISTQSRGIIRTKYENLHLQPAINGQVLKSFMAEDMSVKKGDTLVILRTEKLDEQILLQIKILETNRLFIKDLGELLSNNRFVTTSKYKLEINQYLAKTEEIEVGLNMLKKDFELAGILFNARVTAEIEYLHKKNQFEKALSQQKFFIQQTLNVWEAEKTRLEIENKEILSSMRQLAFIGKKMHIQRKNYKGIAI